jgi:hypothetical protein
MSSTCGTAGYKGATTAQVTTQDQDGWPGLWQTAQHVRLAEQIGLHGGDGLAGVQGKVAPVLGCVKRDQVQAGVIDGCGAKQSGSLDDDSPLPSQINSSPRKHPSPPLPNPSRPSPRRFHQITNPSLRKYCPSLRHAPQRRTPASVPRTRHRR